VLAEGVFEPATTGIPGSQEGGSEMYIGLGTLLLIIILVILLF
jgi:hypothetical protein